MQAALDTPVISKKKWKFLPQAEDRHTFLSSKLLYLRVNNHHFKWIYRAMYIKVARVKMESLRSIIFVKVNKPGWRERWLSG